MAIPQWSFREQQEDRVVSWVWTRRVVNGDAVVTSKPFRTYGEVITDALNAGFRPTDEAWSVTTYFGTTVFQPTAPTPARPAAGGTRDRDAREDSHKPPDA